MLSWWAVIPTLAFVVVQAIFGWPVAKVRASSPDFALPYLMGGMVGGPLIAIVIAWIVYRVFRRSQLAGAITYCIVIGLLCLSVVTSARSVANSPARHIRYRGEPLLIFDKRVSINFPVDMTTFQTPNPERTLGLDLRNPKRRASDFTALVQLGELPASDTLESAENRLGKGVQQHFNLAKAFAWHPLTGAANGAITQPVRGPASDGTNWIMWALVGLDQNQIVLINFTIYATDPADRALYAAAAEKIAASVAPGPAKENKPQ